MIQDPAFKHQYLEVYVEQAGFVSNVFISVEDWQPDEEPYTATYFVQDEAHENGIEFSRDLSHLVESAADELNALAEKIDHWSNISEGDPHEAVQLYTRVVLDGVDYQFFNVVPQRLEQAVAHLEAIFGINLFLPAAK